MQAFDLYQVAYKQIIIEYEALSKRVCSGVAKDYAEYRHYIGRLQSIEHCLDVLSKSFNAGEENDE